MSSDPGRPDAPDPRLAPPRLTPPRLTYAAAGVDIDAGNEAVARIKRHVATTRRPEQLDVLGGFAGLFAMPRNLRDPVLVACTDGVGTKLLVAIATGRHDTVGIDLVAMNVNDLLVTGGEPLFVLDYVATGRVDPGHVEAIVAGICEGCRQAGAALLGGETAEMPAMYADGHYDLAATAVGVVERDRMWGAVNVREGDVVLALPSSGLHSNGYSLARKALLDPAYGGLTLDAPLPGGGGASVADALLVPTRIYARAVAAVRSLEGAPVHAAAHITGGGLIENPPRSIPEHLALHLDLRRIERPAIFSAIAAVGVEDSEMLRTFNCGVGLLLYVDAAQVEIVEKALRDAGEAPCRLGAVVRRRDASAPQVTFAG
jgi:phosphoribosylformylglycinamidine cyclo-ligase